MAQSRALVGADRLNPSVLAPNAKPRALVVPQGQGPEVTQQASEAAAAAGCEAETVQGRPHRIRWARLRKRVFDIEMQHCPSWGSGEFKIIAAILERQAIEEILTHLGLNPQPPPKGPARDGSRPASGGRPCWDRTNDQETMRTANFEP